jgi:lactate racemase
VKTSFLHHTNEVILDLPPHTEVYAPNYPAPDDSAAALALQAIRAPIGCPSLAACLAARRRGEVVIAVSDVTRPIPYATFLPELLGEVEAAGVPRSEVLLLIATGMHRPSTPAERRAMFGESVIAHYRIEDHRAEDDSNLADIPGRSASSASIRLNRRFVEAGFRLTTGLVEPHFMAGFSGGRKAICPGLASLDSVRKFHGPAFMADPRSCNGNLAGNALHAESLSVARLCPPDFTLNVVLDRSRQIVRVFAGELESAHAAACDFVRDCACPAVLQPADVVVTSSGGYPLDATFYQCVKGFVSCLSAVRPGGTLIAFGGCSEGVGGPEYGGLMRQWSGRWQEFLADIRLPGVFTKDQWQFQMHTRALKKVGVENLHFVSDALPAATLGELSVTGHAAAPGQVGESVGELVRRALGPARTLAVFPEGPYCAPIERTSSG